MAPASLALEIVEIGELPLYNQDDDANPPAPSVAFKEKIAAADAVLFVTPEYNRSVPGVLKNAIDVASRPYGKSAWDGKPGRGDQRLARARSAASAPITTCASRWSSSTCRRCRSPRPTSAAPATCSTKPAA